MNRPRFLAMVSSALAAAPALMIPRIAQAQLVTLDPAVLAGVVKGLAHDVIKNKNDLVMIDFIYKQYMSMVEDHHLDIWAAVPDLHNTFKNLAVWMEKNHLINKSETDFAKAFALQYPNITVDSLGQTWRDFYAKATAAMAAHMSALASDYINGTIENQKIADKIKRDAKQTTTTRGAMTNISRGIENANASANMQVAATANLISTISNHYAVVAQEQQMKTKLAKQDFDTLFAPTAASTVKQLHQNTTMSTQQAQAILKANGVYIPAP